MRVVKETSFSALPFGSHNLLNVSDGQCKQVVCMVLLKGGPEYLSISQPSLERFLNYRFHALYSVTPTPWSQQNVPGMVVSIKGTILRLAKGLWIILNQELCPNTWFWMVTGLSNQIDLSHPVLQDKEDKEAVLQPYLPPRNILWQLQPSFSSFSPVNFPSIHSSRHSNRELVLLQTIFVCKLFGGLLRHTFKGHIFLNHALAITGVCRTSPGLMF